MNTNDNRLKAHKLIDHIFQDLLPAHGMAQRPEQIQLSHRMLDAMQDGRLPRQRLLSRQGRSPAPSSFPLPVSRCKTRC